MISKEFVKKKSVNKTYLLKDKEAYIVATSEIDGSHGLPRDISTFTNELKQVLRDIVKIIIVNIIKPKPAKKNYARR